MAGEKDLRHCKLCRDLKQRILDGKYPNAKDKKFVDEHGKQWSGNACPKCHAERTAVNTRNRRARKE